MPEGIRAYLTVIEENLGLPVAVNVTLDILLSLLATVGVQVPLLYEPALAVKASNVEPPNTISVI